MNTMKNIRRNEKALSPAVASIILIAAAIAVGLATCGWLGATASHYTGIAAVTVTNVQFTGASGQPTNAMTLSLKNTGTKAITIEMIKVNGNRLSFSVASGENTTYVPAENKDLTVNNVGWLTGSAYDVEIYGDGAQTVGAYRASAPGT